jgi:nitrite reductase/ring-hydroxylating ferredoxin subunit
LDGKIVTCRWRGGRYDMAGGSTPRVSDYGVPTYPAKVRNSQGMIAVP